MTKQLSSAGATFVEGKGSWSELFQNGLLMFYTGTQPASADAAATGTACVRFSKSAGAVTKEVLGTCYIDFTSSTGHCDTLVIGGIDIIGGACAGANADAIAAAVAAAINGTRRAIIYSAVASGPAVTISAPINTGTSLNGLAITCTVDGGSVAINGGSADTFGVGAGGSTAGVAAANCLSLVYPPVDGVCVKESTAWQGIAGSGAGAGYIGFTNSFTSGTQTVGYARWYRSMDDPELTGTPTLDSGKAYLRMDMAIGTDITATGGTTVTYAATQTQTSFTHDTPPNQG